MINNVDEILKEIKSKVEVSGSYVGIILGSCFSEFVDEIENKIEISMSELKSFKTLGQDKNNKIIFGTLKNKKVIVMLGRLHYVYGYLPADMATPIYVMKELGCEELIMCSSVGAISHKIKVGDIVTVEDHINMTGRNPLYGCDYSKYGYKFIDMSYPYDEELIDTLTYVAKKEMSIKVKRGVIVEFIGPSIETIAESKFAYNMGADLIGLNFCSEVIAAKYCELPVVVYALVTNYASAYTNNKIKHEDIVYNRKCASTYYLELLSRFIESI